MRIEQRPGGWSLPCVLFCLGEQKYALPVEHVGEVVRMVALTEVPESPSWLLGAMNLRGRIVPVVDLRVRLGLSAPAPGLQSPILIVDAEDRVCAFVVDDVLAVEWLPIGSQTERSLEHQPDRALGERSIVAGVSSSKDRLIVVLEAERLTAGSDRFVSAGT